jgi:DNA polymerase-1
MSNTKKLFLLDAMALIYRAHFAFSKAPRVTSKGMNTSATFGFTNTLLEVLLKEKPTHIGVAFDTSAPTFRHVEFKDYKAQRQQQPEDISIAIPYVKKIVEAFNIPVIQKDGFEADDVIGTLALKAAESACNVYMMTPDKDYAQLVRDCVFLYKPSFMGKGIEVWGVKEVLDKWEIERVDQVTDILGLQGDAVDNIPGIPGIGEKTAKKLIAEYGSVENLIANAGNLKGKLQENVMQYAEQGLLSKRLATINIEVPVPYDEDALLYKGPDKEVLMALFDELEFRTMAKRIFGEDVDKSSTSGKNVDKSQMSLFSQNKEDDVDISTTSAPFSTDLSTNRENIHTVIHNYHLVVHPQERQLLINHLLKQKELCFDTETNNINAIEADLVGLAFSYRKGEAYYVPVSSNREEAQKLVDEFKPVFERAAISKVGQNLKYDITVLKRYGIEVQGKIFDTMLAHYLLEPEMRHNMDVLAESYLNYTPVSIESLIGKKGKGQLNMQDVDVKTVAEYAGEDADITLQLKHIFEPEIKAKQLENLLYEVEAPLVDVLADMETEGVKIDTRALQELSVQLGEELQKLESEIYEQAGVKFNIGSPKQLGEILFDRLKLDEKAKKTKTGQYATGEEVLSKLAYEYPIVQHITEYRELQKLKSTYIDALPTLICKDERVHTSYNQAVTATGRLSSTNPNLQNIPIRTERGREIRKAFVPRSEDYLIMSADYSQIELRIMAALSKDESMVNAFKHGVDIHTTTASKVFRVPLDQVTSDMRRKAKTVNFGIIYGISAFGLAQRINIPRKEASSIITAYFEEFPAVKEYMDNAISIAREQEYVTTILGRRRYLPDINSRNMTVRGYAERNAINAPIQGSAADMIKLAMIRIHDWMKKEKLRSKMILQVHDELVFDAHKEELDLLKQHVTDFMQHALPMEVPMEVGLGVGTNWLEAH